MFSNKLNNIIGLIDNLMKDLKKNYNNDIDVNYDYNYNKEDDFELSL